MQRIIRYFVSGHTAEGYVNYIQDNVQGIEQIFTLKHPSNVLKTKVLKGLLSHFKKEEKFEVILSPSGSEFIEGLIIPSLELAFITDSIAVPELKQEVVYLDEFLANKIDTTPIEKAIQDRLDKGYKHFNQALKIYDQLESVYIREMNFKKADKIAEDFIEDVFGGVKEGNEERIVKRRLFGTNTYEGSVNIVPEILERVSKRYFLKGRPGTGKSTFMRRVVSASEKLNLHTEIYHCSFDPHSMDMVLVPDADFCIFDSTQPHEYFPEKEGEESIDLYELTVTEGTDEKFADKIKDITEKYKTEIKKAMEEIKLSKGEQLALEEVTIFNEDEVKNITNTLIENL